MGPRISPPHVHRVFPPEQQQLKDQGIFVNLDLLYHTTTELSYTSHPRQSPSGRKRPEYQRICDVRGFMAVGNWQPIGSRGGGGSSESATTTAGHPPPPTTTTPPKTPPPSYFSYEPLSTTFRDSYLPYVGADGGSGLPAAPPPPPLSRPGTTASTAWAPSSSRPETRAGRAADLHHAAAAAAAAAAVAAPAAGIRLTAYLPPGRKGHPPRTPTVSGGTGGGGVGGGETAGASCVAAGGGGAVAAVRSDMPCLPCVGVERVGVSGWMMATGTGGGGGGGGGGVGGGGVAGGGASDVAVATAAPGVGDYVSRIKPAAVARPAVSSLVVWAGTTVAAGSSA
ncbi:hypothetical protein DFJ73DRAFT_893718 [Zopfochytrium polystomum]|nr:hypothetical protein DFJ73DRAFT_893718 [Zopfochytrium polystomum]